MFEFVAFVLVFTLVCATPAGIALLTFEAQDRRERKALRHRAEVARQMRLVARVQGDPLARERWAEDPRPEFVPFDCPNGCGVICECDVIDAEVIDDGSEFYFAIDPKTGLCECDGVFPCLRCQPRPELHDEFVLPVGGFDNSHLAL